MPSITTWQRLEPIVTDDLALGLQATVHDPLWFLARQWQLGEFAGEDAGSPVWAEVRGDAFRLTRYHPGRLPANGVATGQRWDVNREPLETLAEKDRVLPQWPDLRFSVDAGREFFRLLEVNHVGNFKREYMARYRLREGVSVEDEAARDFLELMAGRVIDGWRLYSDLDFSLRPTGPVASQLPADPVIPQTDQNAVKKAAFAWLEWYDAQANQPLRATATSPASSSAWDNLRMEYAFAVSAPTNEGEIVLTTPGYVGGRLEWDAFSHRPGARLGATPAEVNREEISRKVIPAPLSYRGMPASRWWEFEDAQVQFGAARPLQQDLASMMFVQFAVIYGNDWFVIPVDLPVGSLAQLTALNITDSFGEVTSTKPFAKAGGAAVGWKMFSLSLSGTTGNASTPAPQMLFLPPALGSTMESDPFEEVFLLRDEMANLCWAVESFVASRTGDRIDRRAVYNKRHPPASAGPEELSREGPLHYRLVTDVPDYWIPFVKVGLDDGSFALQQAVLPLPGAHVGEPKSHILKYLRGKSLPDEEIPRSGVRVTRSWQYARWVDGSTHVWVAHRKEPGRGEGSSGLRFDSLKSK